MIKVTKVEKLFPSIEEVFEAPKQWFKYVFFPLLTVEIENEQQQKNPEGRNTPFGNIVARQ